MGWVGGYQQASAHPMSEVETSPRSCGVGLGGVGGEYDRLLGANLPPSLMARVQPIRSASLRPAFGIFTAGLGSPAIPFFRRCLLRAQHVSEWSRSTCCQVSSPDLYGLSSALVGGRLEHVGLVSVGGVDLQLTCNDRGAPRRRPGRDWSAGRRRRR